jgi:micrococcal nuclease
MSSSTHGRAAPARPTLLFALGALVTIASACSSATSSGSTGQPGSAAVAPAGSATVVRVVDGDTIVARVGGHDERVRFIGIDTPETVSPVKPVQCYGKQASDHTKALLPEGTRLRLERDVVARDVYGRLLAYVWRSDGLFVNLELARDGYASLLTIPPNVAHVAQFQAAVASARARGLGLWGRCGGPGVPASERS